MTVPVFVLSALLGAPTQAPPVRPAIDPGNGPAIIARFDTAQLEQERERRTPGERPHTIGIGGQMGVSNRGGGGSFRYFFADRFGANFEVAWYRPRYSATTNGSTFAVLPSFIFMLTDPDPTRDIDLRPYVGAGVNYVRSSRPIATAPGQSSTLGRSGMGGQVFGGVELTFREADFLTISIEGTYYRLPVTYVNANVVGGFNYVLAFHFYLK